PRTIARALEMAGFSGIRTFPGGATRPHNLAQRIISFSAGAVADCLYGLSGASFLLPGVSKTTSAIKAELRHA
ncbi:MAG: hypothetical protein WCG78_08215, partial [Candidatus Omnitrophota bacterium]